VYFLSTACGRPLTGVGFMLTGEEDQKPDFFVDAING